MNTVRILCVGDRLNYKLCVHLDSLLRQSYLKSGSRVICKNYILFAPFFLFFYIYCCPFGPTRAQLCQGIMINRSGTYWNQLSFFVLRTCRSALHIDLASLLVQERRPSLVRSNVSYSTWWCRWFLRPVPDFGFVILSGVLNSEALQLLSYFKPGTVPRHMVESSAPSSPALDLAVGLIS